MLTPLSENGDHCSGEVKVIASIEDPVVIKKTFKHLDGRAEPATSAV